MLGRILVLKLLLLCILTALMGVFWDRLWAASFFAGGAPLCCGDAYLAWRMNRSAASSPQQVWRAFSRGLVGRWCISLMIWTAVLTLHWVSGLPLLLGVIGMMIVSMIWPLVSVFK